MKYMIFMKNIHFNFFLFVFILINKIFITKESNCILKKFNQNEVERMKCKTVSAGYNICVEKRGIYSFNSLLTKSLYYYDFSSIIRIGDIHLLGLVIIEELKMDDITKNIILCFIKTSYLFVLSYKGEFLFFNQVDKQFLIDNYGGIFLYNYIISKKDYNYIFYYTQGFKVNMYQYSINLDEKSNKYIANITYNPSNNAGTSCEFLLDNLKRNVLVCFMFIYSGGNQFSAISFLVGENLEFLSSNILTLDQDFISSVKLIRTSSYDKTRVLVCLIGETETKFAIYNIIDNSLSDFILNIEGCNIYYYSVNLYYFDKTEQFVFSCIDNNINYLKMIPINKDFTIIENNKFEKYEFEGCTNVDILSILFIKPLNIYNTVVVNTCGDYSHPVYNYLLIEDETNCNNTIQMIQQLNETYNEEFDDEEQNSPTLETSQSKATFQITEKLTQSEIIKSTFSNENTEYNQINGPTQSILADEPVSQTQSIEINNVIETSEILETNNDFESNRVIESNKLEETN